MIGEEIFVQELQKRRRFNKRLKITEQSPQKVATLHSQEPVQSTSYQHLQVTYRNEDLERGAPFHWRIPFTHGADSDYYKKVVSVAMLGGSLVTTAWRVLKLRVEETPSR
jgi:hypothetical protein